MGVSHLFATPDSLIENLPAALDENQISHVIDDDREIIHGRHKYRLLAIHCKALGGKVHINVEKRIGRKGAYTTLVPIPRLLLIPNKNSTKLADRVAAMMIQLGADASYDTKCTDV